MTRPTRMHRGPALRLYLLASHAFAPIAGPILRRRLARGKEDPDRWSEKLGQRLLPRPDGPLVWLHAVGLGEVLSLRGLIARMAERRPDLTFLVTSTTGTSARVFAMNLPPRTIHQFLPIDAPAFRRRFLDRFQPDLAVWVEQDIWPGLISDAAARGIPQAVVAARMNARSHASHQKARAVFRDLYRAMALVTAQDQGTADHLTKLGAAGVRVTGSLKPAAPPLSHDEDELQRLRTALKGRTVWAVAPSHPADEALALAAHAMLRRADPSALLIIAPRYPDRRAEILAAIPMPVRSLGQTPGQGDTHWLCDTFGELGLIYRLASTALIGGTFSVIEGHNPWEAAALQTAILHGPRVANFAADFAILDAADAARLVATADEIAQAVQAPGPLAANATRIIATAGAQTDALAGDLISLLGR